MEIPYTVTARPDTGLWNAKVGIWLFLASEVMLFGGLFSAYIFLRLDAAPGYWPHGLLNVPVGTMNTAILIASSVTVVLAWASLKMRQFARYKIYMGITILCGVIFLVVKLAYEWPQKFDHFGAFIKPSALEKYEPYLGNNHLLSRRAAAAGRDHRSSAQSRGAARPQHQGIRNRARSGQHRSDQPEDGSTAFPLRPANGKDRARSRRRMWNARRCFCRRTAPISRLTLRSPGCTACTSSAG